MRWTKIPLIGIALLFVLMVNACDNSEPSSLSEGHFRVSSTTEISRTRIEKIAGSWGIVVQNLIQEPIALQLDLLLPSDANISLITDRLPLNWEGGEISGSIKVRFSYNHKYKKHRYIPATITIAALIDYHYREAKPFPVVITDKRSDCGGNNASLAWSNVPINQLSEKEPFFKLTPLQDGIYEFEDTLEIARFMGKPVFLKISHL